MPIPILRRFVALLLFTIAAGVTWRAQAQPLSFSIFGPTNSWRYNHTDCFVWAGWAASNYDDSGVNWQAGPGGFTGGETRAEALLGVTTTSLPATNSGTRAERAMYFRTKFRVDAVG